MNPDRWRQIEQMCHAALEREPGTRAAFLDEACAGDAELRSEVESLLAGQSAARSFLERPPLAATARSAPVEASTPDGSAGAPLTTGTRLGPYEITALVGAGGMGQVYKARDTRLNRTVAIKVLPPELTKDPERLRRFEQEARAVSALNHPHIVTLHEFGTSGAGPYLVLEMIEGRSIGDMLRAGPLPVKRILAIGAQIAEGLAKAHAAGIIHRDLKPDNVMVSDDGFAKILDFGLAKLVLPEFDANASDETRSLAARTASGMILGTLGYMSPEQASGRPVDFRADHFALGALLYEMATAERPFRGGTAMESLAAVIREEPVPVRSKRPEVPPQLGWLIERCLAKEPADRYASTRDLARDLADLRDHLSEISHGELVGGPAPPHWLLRETAAWILAAIALAASGALLMYRSQPAATPPSPVRATILPPPGLEFNLVAGIALSPDGTKLLFRAGNTLWVRALDELTPKPLPGTDGAEFPFWSPDSRAIGFFSGGRLFRMRLEEASPTLVCEATAPRGGSWGADDVILFGSRTTVRRVSAAGGPVTDATSLDPQHFGHKWPSFLPDGRHFLYAANLREWKTAPLALFLGSLDGTPARRLGESWSGPVYAEPGFVLSVTFPARTLVARRLDLANARLASDSISITSDTSLTSQRWNAAVSAAPTGRLVYVTGTVFPPGRLVWTDRTGRESEAMGSAHYWDTTVSPDGRRAVAAIENDDRATADLWEIDLERQTRSRRLTDTPDDEQLPILTPDGQEVFYGARRRGSVVDLFRRRLDAGSEEKLVRALEGEGFPCAVSLDRKLLLYSEIRPGQAVYNLWLLPLDGGKPRPFQVDQYRKNCGPISRDGRWALSTSTKSGRAEVYVQPFPAGRPAYQVSKGAYLDARPAWSPTGNEIYYFDERGRIMSVTVTFGQMPVPGSPQVLFEDGGTSWGFGVAGGTRVRFLRLLPDASAPKPSLTVLTRWLPEKLR